jgi:hypothetical protein
MRVLLLARCASVVCAGIISLAGCGGDPLAGPAPESGVAPATAHRRGAPPTCPVPAVWISQYNSSYGIVEGYTASGTAIACTINNGGASGSYFDEPFGLASDKTGNLYVADVYNKRVVVFNSGGSYIDTLQTKSSVYPHGVCVSPHGVVGVADFNFGTGAGDIEFFGSGISGNMTAPSGWATGVDTVFQWCAFDRKGNFFATGTTSGGSQEIVYLRASSVNTPAATLSASTISTTPYWESMYVQLKCSDSHDKGETLAVANLTPEIEFFKINPSSGAPSPTPISTLPLTGYPTGTNNMEQDALNDECYTKSTVYFADYGGSEALQTKEYSGAISVFNASVTDAAGVATNPTGQE